MKLIIAEVLRKELHLALEKERKHTEKMITDKLKPITLKIESLATFKEDVKKSVDFTHTRIDDIYEQTIPVINHHISTIASALTQRLLDLDVHRRKWSLNIQGIRGNAGEDEEVTRAKVVAFASDKLGIQADVKDYAACHRLSQEANSGIIMRFQDLSQRNAWLENAKNLRRHPDCANVSISPDLPNDLRPLKTELLNIRKTLPREQKKNSTIRYLKQWPFVELRVKNQPTRRPSESLSNVCERVLGLSKDTLLLKVAEPDRDDPPHIRDIAFPASADEGAPENDGDDVGLSDDDY